MNRKLSFPLLAFAAFLFSGLSSCNSTKSSDPNGGKLEERSTRKDFLGYPDFGAMISVDSFVTYYPGRKIFKLRQDYPKTLPGEDKIPAFFKIPFDDKTRWKEWIMAVRDYCFDGMIEADFIPQNNKKRDWYHMPWLHWGNLASEGFSGLIKEAPISPYQLAPNQKKGGQVYAVGFYNDFAGYTMHKMWKNEQAPDPYATQGPNGGFPHGTVIFKLLFTELDESDVPYLKEPFQRTAYITPTFNENVKRSVRNVQLIQMDIMVRDKAADKYGTGWIFGTFCYNGDINKGKSMKERVKNLVPVGIQFGNDPDYTTNWLNPYPVSKTMINDTLKQTFINPDADLPPQHLGWGGRLDGPVDLNTSSCMSCHATAESPQLAPLVPKEAFIGDTLPNGAISKLTQTNAPAWKKYYQNFRCGTAYDPGKALSTDFSLQVSLALQYFWQWKNANIAGYYADEYQKAPNPVRRSGLPPQQIQQIKKWARTLNLSHRGTRVTKN